MCSRKRQTLARHDPLHLPALFFQSVEHPVDSPQRHVRSALFSKPPAHSTLARRVRQRARKTVLQDVRPAQSARRYPEDPLKSQRRKQAFDDLLRPLYNLLPVPEIPDLRGLSLTNVAFPHLRSFKRTHTRKASLLPFLYFPDEFLRQRLQLFELSLVVRYPDMLHDLLQYALSFAHRPHDLHRLSRTQLRTLHPDIHTKTITDYGLLVKHIIC